MTDGDQLSRFVAALREAPIPAAPLPRDNRLELLGLNLLDLALNQEHIGRMSERLTLTDATHLTRQVSLEIEPSALPPARQAALAADPVYGTPVQFLWLPLSRQIRKNSGWVEVSDIDGRRFPTMSNQQTEQALIQALRKAFEMYLESLPDVWDKLAAVRTRYHRSRWLIEATITAVIENGGGGQHQPAPRIGRGEDTDSPMIRDKAEAVVRALFDEDDAFLRMLDIATREHLLVVKIPANRAELVLRYDAPGALETSTDRRRSRFRREFTVRYQTVIPRAVDTYEVTLEVPEGIQVRRFLVATATDRGSVRALVEDMRATASRYSGLGDTSAKLLQLELHGIASRLAELGRRRERDLQAFRSYIADCYATFTTRSPRFSVPPRNEDADTRLAVTRRVVTRLAQFATLYEADHFRRLAEGTLSESALREWADELESAELDMSLDFDNDPRENMGRIRWRRRNFGGEPATSEPVEANVYMSLVDDPISLSSGVSKLVLSVLLLVAAFAVLLQPRLLSDFPLLGNLAASIPGMATSDNAAMSSADAVVTVLLLVPALLISRTQLPPRSLLGRLLVWPRFVAYASVISVVLLALCVASLPANALWPSFLLVMATLALMLIVITVDFATKAIMRRNRVPPYRLIPAWLPREVSRWPRKRPRSCVANFASTEREDND